MEQAGRMSAANPGVESLCWPFYFSRYVPQLQDCCTEERLVKPLPNCPSLSQLQASACLPVGQRLPPAPRQLLSQQQEDVLGTVQMVNLGFCSSPVTVLLHGG